MGLAIGDLVRLNTTRTDQQQIGIVNVLNLENKTTQVLTCGRNKLNPVIVSAYDVTPIAVGDKVTFFTGKTLMQGRITSFEPPAKKSLPLQELNVKVSHITYKIAKCTLWRYIEDTSNQEYLFWKDKWVKFTDSLNNERVGKVISFISWDKNRGLFVKVAVRAVGSSSVTTDFVLKVESLTPCSSIEGMASKLLTLEENITCERLKPENPI